ncbi:MAG TPA: hypothetical protein VLM39_00040, partial [Ignavibacteriaceae bacterium]|nr:hypothetical protein [Ignavibacteriaceae bacterium]
TAINGGEGHGIKGQSTGTGVYGESDDWYGVYGFSPAGTGVGGKSNTGSGVSAESGTGYGLYAFSEFGHGIHAGSLNDYGIVGITTNGWGGVYGEKTGKAHGVLGYHNTSDQLFAGVYGWGGSEFYAGRFDGTVLNYGSVYIYNDLSVYGDEYFGTDHPLDPANKYLVHSSVTGPERMNIYNGNAVTDASGKAVVKLPDYFEAFNTDFRYQLTVIGKQAQVWIETEIQNNRMTISSDKPNVKVSWQVTGIRNDEYAKQHPFTAEQQKEDKNKGKYLRPELFGQPQEKGIYQMNVEKQKVK